jgi:hypothetical protein
MVEARGIEPLFSRCERDVLPLNEAPKKSGQGDWTRTSIHLADLAPEASGLPLTHALMKTGSCH